MRLKKLEIYGFKSFAERTEIVFEQGITGIVGPNGSGKSNISDAVRWVLGEQNARSLRGGKMEDIIFNGTQTRKRLGYCEVSLVFDNQAGQLPIDFAEVMVTRRVYRSGESEYYLNKTACRLKDIVDLFRDTGIGKEGYSLIGQGRIDEILSARSEDRRQVFEEAAGIVKYKARKDEAQRRMENTRQNLDRVEDILEELGRQLEPLAEQSENAKVYLSLRDQLRDLELNAFLVRSDRIALRLGELTDTLTALGEAIADREGAIARDAQEAQAQEETLTQQQAQLSQAHALVLEAARSLEVAEGEHNVLRTQLSSARQEEERIRKALAEARQRLGGVERLSQGAHAQADDRVQAFAQQRAAYAASEAALKEAQRQVTQGEADLEQAKADIIEAMNRLSDVRAGQARLETMGQSILERLTEQTQTQAQLEAASQPLAQALEAAEEASRQAEGGLNDLKAEAVAQDEQVRQDGQRIETLTQQLQAQRGRQQALASRLKVLREMERDYEGYQHAVKQVLLHAKGDQGVYGVVANLLRVPAKIEKALEAVLGGALQHIVTRDEYVAKAMIDYLRAGRYGRASFMPVTTIQGRTLSAGERQVLSMPGCLGVASELVGFDPQFAGIMENLLGRTVIATDLNAGIEIMRKGRQAFRLVTLEGDVMHSGGMMTGGSAQSRMTSLLSREREIAEHAQALEDIAAAIEAAKGELAQLEAARGEAKQRRAALYHQLHQQEIAVARDKERLDRAQAAYGAHQKELVQAALAAEQMQDTLKDIQDQLAGAKSRQDDTAQDTAGMQRRVQAMQAELLGLRDSLEQLREADTAQRVALAALEKEIASAQRDRTRIAQEKQELAAQIQGDEQQQAQCQALQAQLAEEITHMQASQGDQKQVLAQAQEALADLEHQIAKRQHGLRILRTALDDAREALSHEVERQHRAQMQAARQEADLKAMQERIWEEYELTYAGAEGYRRADFDLGEAERSIDKMRGQIRQMGPVNISAIEDYRACRTRYEELTTQKEDLTRAEADLQGIIEGLVVKMEKQFREQFALLGGYFSQTFERLFGGGQAQLRLMDEDDVLGCGIEIVAQPPGKKLQLLSLLSGGERALTAIAILFAMLRLKPTPFCILDEIEAALDDANIGYFADYLSEFAQNTQFVVVTHRKGTMARCDALYGVAMEEKGISRMVSVQLTDTAG